MHDPTRVLATAAAVDLIERLRAAHGPLIFHQSGGCCDGSAPMCYAADEFYVDHNDTQLGAVAGCPFYTSNEQLERWLRSRITLDVAPGRAPGFSLEGSEGVRFVVRETVLSGAEAEALEAL
jgi:hypothetical protein